MHPRIIQLSPILSNQIAAGEVVERPASVVKELVENSIDAGATKIEVEIEGGGMHLIRVRDNGVGILKSDLMLAFSRHATSKIRTVQDLSAISSLGFRGEALASIASVSLCRLLSQPLMQEKAWQIQIASDLTSTLCPVAHPFGTTVEVADLFYNTPVRRKFLRSEKTEFQYIDDVIKRLALGASGISFGLKHQQKQVRFYPKASATNESARIGKICGQQFINQAMNISMEAVGLSLKGWVGLPTIGRRQADCQYFFVNGRMIKDRLLNHVIKTIYHQHPQMVEGSYPCYVLYLTLDLHDVDVNVHPTKQEVRFTQARLVHDFMTKCISEVLDTNCDVVNFSVSQLCKTVPESKRYSPLVEEQQLERSSNFYQEAMTRSSEKRETIVSSRYAFIEEDQGTVIIDLKKAKSSLLAFYFENNWPSIPTKSLLFPRSMTLSKSYPMNDLAQILATFGFGIKFIDKRKLLLLQQPVILTDEIQDRSLEEFIQLVSTTQQKKTLALSLGQILEASLSLVPNLSVFLQEWVLQAKKGEFLRLGHQQIASMMSQDEQH